MRNPGRGVWPGFRAPSGGTELACTVEVGEGTVNGYSVYNHPLVQQLFRLIAAKKY